MCSTVQYMCMIGRVMARQATNALYRLSKSIPIQYKDSTMILDSTVRV